jgi:hypothetical protein
MQYLDRKSRVSGEKGRPEVNDFKLVAFVDEAWTN